MRAYRDFPSRPGTDIRLDNVGYLFLLTSAEQAADFETSVKIQNSLNVPSRMVGPGEARQLCPYLSTDGLVAAVYSPNDGHARPDLVIQGYADSAAQAGVTFATHTAVTGIDTAGDLVTAVHTSQGLIACSAVICAAGAWSGQIGDMVGVDLPVRPVRRQLAFTVPLTPPAPRIPFTIDFTSSAYFHNSDDGLLFGLADPRQAEGFDTTWTPEWLELFRDVVRRRPPLWRTSRSRLAGRDCTR